MPWTWTPAFTPTYNYFFSKKVCCSSCCVGAAPPCTVMPVLALTRFWAGVHAETGLMSPALYWYQTSGRSTSCCGWLIDISALSGPWCPDMCHVLLTEACKVLHYLLLNSASTFLVLSTVALQSLSAWLLLNVNASWATMYVNCNSYQSETNRLDSADAE